MSFILSSNGVQPPPPYPHLSHKEIGQEFCKYYYNAFASNGINGIANLYHPEALITFLEEECVGSVAFSQKLNNLGLTRLLFNNLVGTTQPHNNDTVIISVSGDCCAHTNHWGKFSDVFVISLMGGNWVIVHHIFKVVV